MRIVVSFEYKLKVGSKGELFLPKNIREKLGLKPGDKLLLKVSDNGLIIQKVPDLLEMLELPPISNLQTVDEIEMELDDI